MQDHYDVKMPCHLLLSKLAVKAGGHVLAALDTICRPLEKTLTNKLKGDAVKQEVGISTGCNNPPPPNTPPPPHLTPYRDLLAES